MLEKWRPSQPQFARAGRAAPASLKVQAAARCPAGIRSRNLVDRHWTRLHFLNLLLQTTPSRQHHHIYLSCSDTLHSFEMPDQSQSFASDATEEAQATWEFWPNPPPPGDFAKLIPACNESKRLFQQQIADIKQRRERNDEPFFSDKFVHFEATTPEHAYPATIESSGSEREKTPPNTVPCVTGYFRLNLEEPRPNNLGIGWRIGTGRRNQEVEFLLAHKGQVKELRGVHARLRREVHGVLTAFSDNHEFWIGNHKLKATPGQAPQQRALDAQTTLHIAGLSYRVEPVPVSPERELKQLQDLAKVLNKPAPEVILTPQMDAGDSTRGDYFTTHAFSSGASAKVCYAWHKDTGAAFAMKIVTLHKDYLSDLVENEVKMLQACNSHVSVTTTAPSSLQRLCTSEGCFVPEYPSETQGTSHPHIVTKAASSVEILLTADSRTFADSGTFSISTSHARLFLIPDTQTRHVWYWSLHFDTIYSSSPRVATGSGMCHRATTFQQDYGDVLFNSSSKSVTPARSSMKRVLCIETSSLTTSGCQETQNRP